MSVSSDSEKQPHLDGHAVDELDVDVAATLATGSESPLDPAEALRLRRKLDLHIMPFMCILYLMTFADKITLGQSAVMGLILCNHGFYLNVRTDPALDPVPTKSRASKVPCSQMDENSTQAKDRGYHTRFLDRHFNVLYPRGAIKTRRILVFFFPDSPVSAHFLTPEERVKVVQRIKTNQSGIENKHWKQDQFVEALRDPKTWLLALFVGSTNLFNSVTNQRQLIVSKFGYTLGQTTLLGTVDGAVQINLIPYVGHCYAAIMSYIPAVIGCVLLITLPSENKLGLLFSYWISETTVNAIVLIGYAIGNAVSNFMWKKSYQPRNRVPWSILTGFCVFSALLLFILRTHLSRENKRRDDEQHDGKYDDVYLTHVEKDGTTVEVKVDK
ncbi:hypothetical protein H0H93_013834, partial [Arthromyces matolae]